MAGLTCGLVVLALQATAKLAVVPGSTLMVEASKLKSGWPTKRAVYTTALLPCALRSTVLTCDHKPFNCVECHIKQKVLAGSDAFELCRCYFGGLAFTSLRLVGASSCHQAGSVLCDSSTGGNAFLKAALSMYGKHKSSSGCVSKSTPLR